MYSGVRVPPNYVYVPPKAPILDGALGALVAVAVTGFGAWLATECIWKAVLFQPEAYNKKMSKLQERFLEKSGVLNDEPTTKDKLIQCFNRVDWIVFDSFIPNCPSRNKKKTLEALNFHPLEDSSLNCSESCGCVNYKEMAQIQKKICECKKEYIKNIYINQLSDLFWKTAAVTVCVGMTALSHKYIVSKFHSDDLKVGTTVLNLIASFVGFGVSHTPRILSKLCDEESDFDVLYFSWVRPPK